MLYTTIGTYDDCISAQQFVKELKTLELANSKVNLRINSGGGSVYEGIAIFNAIRNSRCEIDCYIDGIAASMASLIAMACKKVYMSKYARLMTHLPSGGAWGNAAELRTTADELDALTATAVLMYKGKTGLNDADVTAKFLNGKDSWFSAAEAKKAGLIDDIYDGAAVAIPDNVTDKTALWNTYNMQLNHEQTLIIIS